MAKRFEIDAVQKFTADGTLGVWLFLGGPIASAVGYGWLLSELTKRFGSEPLAPLIVIGVGGFASLAGAVLMLIGRSQHFTIRSVEERPDDGTWR
ncbi:MAG: hypothetical protein M9939_20700 [Mesorhizobium sp.]|nr:hypothetical protein [Mesorhizobium sp.]MCO5163555.1 hypothetical protein [Mesorhizobium sp.]